MDGIIGMFGRGAAAAVGRRVRQVRSKLAPGPGS